MRGAAPSIVRSSIDVIGEAFVIYDAADRLVYCNEQYKKLYEASAAKMHPGVSFRKSSNTVYQQYSDAIGRAEWIEERMKRHREANHDEYKLADGRWCTSGTQDPRWIYRGIAQRYHRNHARERENASTAKSRFLATMSHELAR